MSLHLYFHTPSPRSEEELATAICNGLKKRGVPVQPPIEAHSVHAIKARIGPSTVVFHIGKANKPELPANWYIWPEYRPSLLGHINKGRRASVEQRAQLVLEALIHDLDGVSTVHWDI